VESRVQEVQRRANKCGQGGELLSQGDRHEFLHAMCYSWIQPDRHLPFLLLVLSRHQLRA
jgi:hypothetical protein